MQGIRKVGIYECHKCQKRLRGEMQKYEEEVLLIDKKNRVIGRMVESSHGVLTAVCRHCLIGHKLDFRG